MTEDSRESLGPGPVWGRAGQRLDPRDSERRRRGAAALLHRRRAADLAESRLAYRRWRAGLVVPHRITMALDLGGHTGPDVDRLCHAQEPEVDQWEAGERYPTWEQLLALAALTGCTPQFFTTDREPPPELWMTTIWHQMSAAERGAHEKGWKPPVARYPRAVLDARPPSPAVMPTVTTRGRRVIGCDWRGCDQFLAGASPAVQGRPDDDADPTRGATP